MKSPCWSGYVPPSGIVAASAFVLLASLVLSNGSLQAGPLDRVFQTQMYARDISSYEAGITDEREIILEVYAWCNYGALSSVRFKEGDGDWECSTNACSLYDYKTYNPFSYWTLQPGDGPKYLRTQVTNSWLDHAEALTVIYLDTQPPEGQIEINNGHLLTGDRTVYLNLHAEDSGGGLGSFAVRNQGDSEWSWWTLSTWLDQRIAIDDNVMAWELQDGNGSRTVEYKVADKLGHESPVYSATIELNTQELKGFVELFGNSVSIGTDGLGKTVKYSNYQSLMARVTAQGAAYRFKLRETGDAWGALHAYPSSPVSMRLRDRADGARTVELQVFDTSEKAAPVATDTVILDRAAPSCSIVINGDNETTTLETTLTLLSTDALSGTKQMRFRNESQATWSNWQTYATNADWTLSNENASAQGAYPRRVYAQFRDQAGNISECYDDIVLLVDSTLPEGWVMVDSDKVYVTTPDLTLIVAAWDVGGVKSMRFKNDDGEWLDNWQPYATRANWTLRNQDGIRYIWYQFADFAGHVSPPASKAVMLDTTPPSGQMTIRDPGGTGITTTRNVTLDLAAADSGTGANAVRFKNDSGNWSPWMTLSSSATWTLTDGDGPKTVWAQFRDGAGFLSDPVQDGIVLNSNPPVGTITINHGEPFTNSTNVTLSAWANDPGGTVVSMRFDNNNGAWSDWMAYPAGGGDIAWILSSTEGTRTVRAQFKNNSGITSTAVADSIVLDTTAPYPCWNAPRGLSIAGGVAMVGSREVMLTICGGDQDSGVSLMRLRNKNGQWTEWMPYATSAPWTLEPNPTKSWVNKWVFVEFQDAAGNVSSCPGTSSYDCWDEIGMDTAPPSGTIKIDQAMDCWTPNACLTSRDVTVTPNVGDESSVVSTRLRNSVDDEWSEWMPYLHQQPIPWELTQPDGRVSVEAEFMDEFGNTGIISSTPIVLDTTAPVGFISINDDQEWTTSEKVVLSVGATDAWPVIWVRYTENPDSGWGRWETRESFQVTRDWTFQNGTGVRTIHVQYRDVWQNISPTYSDSINLDSVPPTVSISIDDDAEFTASGLVDLTILADDVGSGLDAMRLRGGTTQWSDWMPVADRQTWVLTGEQGPNVVEIEVRDLADNITGSSDGIYLDNRPPEGQLVINDSSEMTQTAEVTLTIEGHDEGSGLAQMSFSNDGLEWSPWEPFATSREWILSYRPGIRTVSVRFMDAAGSIGPAALDTILLDSLPLAETGGPYFVEVNSNLTLDSTASSDPDIPAGDKITEFLWNLDGDDVFDVSGETVVLSWEEIELAICDGPGTCEEGREYPITLRITDSFDVWSEAGTTVTFFVNQPVARMNASHDACGCGETVSFDGSASDNSAPDREIVEYAWDFDFDGTNFDVDATGPSTTHSFNSFGHFTVALRVTDNNEPALTDITTRTVSATLGNTPPTADAGGPYVMIAGDPLEIDAGASFDPDTACGDRIASVMWDLDDDGSFDDGSELTLALSWADVESRLCNGTCRIPNRYRISVQVSDMLGETSVDRQAVSILQPLADGCGDRLCDDGENAMNCQVDCDRTKVGISTGPGDVDVLTSAAQRLGARSFSVELHFSGILQDDTNFDFHDLTDFLETDKASGSILIRTSFQPDEIDFSTMDPESAFARLLGGLSEVTTGHTVYFSTPVSWDGPTHLAMTPSTYEKLIRISAGGVRSGNRTAGLVIGDFAFGNSPAEQAWWTELLDLIEVRQTSAMFDILGVRLFGSPDEIAGQVGWLRQAMDARPGIAGKPIWITGTGGPTPSQMAYKCPAEAQSLMAEAAINPCIFAGDLSDYPEAMQLFSFAPGRDIGLDVKRDRMQAREQVERILVSLTSGADRVWWHSISSPTVHDCEIPIGDIELGKLRLVDGGFDDLPPTDLPTFEYMRKTFEWLGEPTAVNRLNIGGDSNLMLFEVTRQDGETVLVAWQNRDRFDGGDLPPEAIEIPIEWARARVESLFSDEALILTGPGSITLNLTNDPVLISRAEDPIPDDPIVETVEGLVPEVAEEQAPETTEVQVVEAAEESVVESSEDCCGDIQRIDASVDSGSDSLDRSDVGDAFQDDLNEDPVTPKGGCSSVPTTAPGSSQLPVAMLLAAILVAIAALRRFGGFCKPTR